MKHTSANVVHSAARQRLTLCRSTTYRAHQVAWAYLWRGSRGTAQRRPQPTAARNLLRHRGKKENCAHSSPETGAGPLTPTTRTAPDPRARTGCIPVVGGGEGYGRRSRMSGERHAGSRVTRVRATPEGRWAGCGGAARGGHGHEERRSQIDAEKAGGSWKRQLSL